MQSNERVEKAVLIAEVFSDIVLYYRSPPLDDRQMDMYVRDLMSMSYNDIVLAMEIYRNNPNNRVFPLPSQLKALIVPSDEVQARDAVSRIVQAMSKWSGSYDYHIQKAKEFIGELGWLVVERQGGWSRLMRLDQDDLGPTAQAQWRELAISLCRKQRMGVLDTPPALPEGPPAERGLLKLGDFMKSLDHHRH